MRLIVILTVLLCMLPGRASAQEEDLAAARRLNDEATNLFDAGQFEAAAQKYRAAFEITPDPLLLVFESASWFKAGSCDRARDAAAKYRDASTEAPPPQLDQVEIGCHLADAEAALDADDLDVAERALAAASGLENASEKQAARLSELQARLESARTPPPRKQVKVANEPEQPEDAGAEAPGGRSGPNPRKVIGWSLIGAGALGIGVQVVAFANFESRRKALEGEISACEGECSASVVAEHGKLTKIKNREPLYWVVGGVGTALLATGIVLLALPAESSAQVLLSPTSIAVQWRF